MNFKSRLRVARKALPAQARRAIRPYETLVSLERFWPKGNTIAECRPQWKQIVICLPLARRLSQRALLELICHEAAHADLARRGRNSSEAAADLLCKRWGVDQATLNREIR